MKFTLLCTETADSHVLPRATYCIYFHIVHFRALPFSFFIIVSKLNQYPCILHWCLDFYWSKLCVNFSADST